MRLTVSAAAVLCVNERANSGALDRAEARIGTGSALQPIFVLGRTLVASHTPRPTLLPLPYTHSSRALFYDMVLGPDDSGAFLDTLQPLTTRQRSMLMPLFQALSTSLHAQAT